MDYFIKRSTCVACTIELNAMKLRKIYRCKKCHQDVCANCSTNRIWLYSPSNHFVKDYSIPQRVCTLCYNDYLITQEHINSYHLKWNTNSLLFNKFIGNAKRTEVVLAEYIPEYDIIANDAATGRSDANVFNYSMREFISQCQKGIPIDDIRKSILHVLTLMVAHNPFVGYCQGMNQIAVFLLCIADEEGAFQLMAHLFDKIIPKRFYSSTGGASLIGFQAEQNFLLQVIKGRDPKYADKLCKFLEIQAPQFLLTLLLQSFNSSCVFAVWTHMFKIDNFTAIDNGLLFALECARDLDLHKPAQMDTILRLVQYDQLVKTLSMGDVYFSQFERKIMIEQFYASTSRQWVNNEQLIIFRLKKISNFDAEEIQIMQTEFKKYCMENVRIKDSQIQQQLLEEQNLTGSSDEEDNRSLQIQQLEQTRLNKYGINKQTFLKLMQLFHQNYDQQTHQYDTIFDLFDEHHTGLLDFREFLICLSVVLRGTFEQKLKMFFSAHQQQRLNKEQFMSLLFVIFDEHVRCTEEYGEFVKRINKKTLTYLDMLQIAQDDFIQGFEKRSERRGTCVKLANSLRQIISE